MQTEVKQRFVIRVTFLPLDFSLKIAKQVSPPGPSGECSRRIRDVGGIVRNSPGGMPAMLSYVLDLSVIVSAFVASVLWLRASKTRFRRVSKHEELDHADHNRIVTALNRTQILNSQAALATGFTTALACLHLIVELI